MNGPCGRSKGNASEPEANLYKKVSRDRDIPLTLLPVLAKNKNAIAPRVMAWMKHGVLCHMAQILIFII